jgi:replicative DNA helicase
VRERASGSGVDRLDDIVSEAIDMISNGSGRGDRIKRTRAGFGETAAGVIERINHAYMDGGQALSKTLVTTGSAALDRKIGGWRHKFFYVLAGRPGMGKSTCAMSWLLRTARKGGGVLVFSLEMGGEALAERCLSDLSYRHDSPIPYERMGRNQIDASDIERLIDAERQYHALPMVIEEKAGLTVAQMRVIAQNVAQRMAEKGQRLDVVLVDHLGKVKASGNYKGNKVAETGEVSGGLAEMAKDLDVAVIALAQLSRQVEGREDKRPTLSDLRWAGEIEQDVDVAMFLYREAYYLERQRGLRIEEQIKHDDRLAEVRHQIDVDIAKQRGGATGALTLWCDVACAAVRDLAPEGTMQGGLGI